MPSHAVAGVLFDIDDTLIDTKAAFAAAISAVAGAYLPHLTADQHAAVLDMWRADSSGHYRAYTRGEVDFDTQRWRRANELHAAFGGPELTAETYPGWRDIFWGTFERSWTLFDDVLPVLDTLAAASVVCGAVTNASVELQSKKLAAAGIADRVPLLVGVDTFGVGKPDPRVFREGARLLGLDPARVAYVGDELDVDAGGAASAGLVGVWLDRPGTRRGGSHLEDESVAADRGIGVVHSLAQLPELLGIGA